MSKLSDIANKSTIKQYAQGLAQSMLSPIADWLAPTVEVASPIGYYKSYSEKNRYRIPETNRGLGEKATKIGWSALDKTYNCRPHALDCQIDSLENLAINDLENAYKEAANLVAEAAALSHENEVINAALTTLGSGISKEWDSSSDPIDDIDEQIESIMKNCGYGGLMNIKILFGAKAWRIFKNSQSVQSRFIGGSRNINIPNIADVSQLILGAPEARVSYTVYDENPEGKSANMKFLLDSDIIIFASSTQPTRRDPSFMKTFRLANQWMVSGSYLSEDGREEVAKMDWSCEAQVTNSTAGVRLSIS